MALQPGDKLGPYEILVPIGAGGMGDVYKANDTRLDRVVAIKTSKEQFTERFEREGRTVAALNHSNIAQLFDIGALPSGAGFLVMEYVEGSEPKGPLPVDEVLKLTEQIANALDAAHEKGITHRDLKPANIKIKPDGTVKVLDFGLAKLGQDATRAGGSSEASPTLTMHATEVGMILGTAGYMSPEQARGKHVDRRADIWAFGVVLYELLTGKKLFVGEEVVDILAAIVKSEPDLSAAPVQFHKLLTACLQKDPKQRLQAAGDWKLLLSRDSDGAAGASGSAPSQSRLGKIAIAAAAVFAIVAAGLGFGLYRATRPAELKPLVRLDLDLGSDRNVPAGTGPDVILSPDGTRLAYVFQGRLFTRRLDQSQGTELPGTQGAMSPFFSPDSQWIAFGNGGKLAKVSLAGGAAVTLCDAPLFQGGSWGEDGTIVASLSQAGGLSRIPAEGGAAVPLTKMDPRGRVRTHRWPQILPGGKTVVFTSNSSAVGGFDDASIEAVSLEDGHQKTLRQGGTFGRYLPSSKGSGHLVYVNRGTLFAVPFDPVALENRGPAVPILDQIAYSALNGPAKLDASPNGTLIYETGGSDAGLVTVQWLEEGGKTGPLLAKPGNYGRPSLSPDGRRLALEILDGSNRDIWVQDAERDTATRLTFDGKVASPLWTPDGRSVVFQDPEGLSWTRADGGGKPQPLLRMKGLSWAWSFAPDGKRLGYFELGTGSYDIRTVPIEGDGAALRAGKPEVLLQTPFDERYPVFSPDGRWLAYVSNESGLYEIYVRAFPDAASGGGKWQISSGGGAYPMWSRTGRQLFFETLDSRVMTATYAVQGNSFAAEKPRLWSERQLANLVNSSRNIDIAPDGKRFAVIMPVEQAGSQQAGSQAARSRVTLIENFFDELRRKVPASK